MYFLQRSMSERSKNISLLSSIFEAEFKRFQLWKAWTDVSKEIDDVMFTKTRVIISFQRDMFEVLKVLTDDCGDFIKTLVWERTASEVKFKIFKVWKVMSNSLDIINNMLFFWIIIGSISQTESFEAWKIGNILSHNFKSIDIVMIIIVNNQMLKVGEFEANMLNQIHSSVVVIFKIIGRSNLEIFKVLECVSKMRDQNFNRFWCQ